MKSSPIFCTLCLSLIRFFIASAYYVARVSYSGMHINSIVDYIGNFLRSIISLHSVDRYRRKTVKHDLPDISTDPQRTYKAFSILAMNEMLLNKRDDLACFYGNNHQDWCNAKAKSFLNYQMSQIQELKIIKP